jgi:hypothetical protein
MRKNVDVGPGGNAFKEISAFYLEAIPEASLLDERRSIADHVRQVEEDSAGPRMLG